jgi:hypothetical protein
MAIATIVVATRLLQLFQSKVLHVLPFGSLAQVSLLDTCIGIFITGVFHLYLVVIRSSLAPFDCTDRDGTRTMDAEPRVVCDHSGVHGRMWRVAVLSLVVYGVGVPAFFSYFLVTHRAAIDADQRLRQAGEGELAITNPNLHIRRCVLCLCLRLQQQCVFSVRALCASSMQALQEAVRGLQAGVQVLEAGTAGPQVRARVSRNHG